MDRATDSKRKQQVADISGKACIWRPKHNFGTSQKWPPKATKSCSQVSLTPADSERHVGATVPGQPDPRPSIQVLSRSVLITRFSPSGSLIGATWVTVLARGLSWAVGPSRRNLIASLEGRPFSRASANSLVLQDPQETQVFARPRSTWPGLNQFPLRVS